MLKVIKRMAVLTVGLAAMFFCLTATANTSESAKKPYMVDKDGAVDLSVLDGYRRYHNSCHVCHGPAGLGSSYAPSIIERIKKIGYDNYLSTVAGGNEDMPAFGTDPNVMCFIDDIYHYLLARANGDVGRNRPKSNAPREAILERRKETYSCLGLELLA